MFIFYHKKMSKSGKLSQKQKKAILANANPPKCDDIEFHEEIKKAREAKAIDYEQIRKKEIEREQTLAKKYSNIKMALFTFNIPSSKKLLKFGEQSFVKKEHNGVSMFLHKETADAIIRIQIELGVTGCDLRDVLETSHTNVLRTIATLTNDMVFDEITLQKKEKYISYFIKESKEELKSIIDNTELISIIEDPNCSLIALYYIVYCAILNPRINKGSTILLVNLLHLWSSIIAQSDEISDAIMLYYFDNKGDFIVFAVSSSLSRAAFGIV